jgi:hypothetical protein
MFCDMEPDATPRYVKGTPFTPGLEGFQVSHKVDQWRSQGQSRSERTDTTDVASWNTLMADTP